MMEKKLELRLARVLRHVFHSESIELEALILKASKAQGMTKELASAYIGELVHLRYLNYHPEIQMVTLGENPLPAEINSGGYYRFESECWACGQTIVRNLDIYTSRIHWDCAECQVKWIEDVG